MMATDIIKIDASWAEKWTKTGVPFLSAPTVQLEQFFLKASLTEEECSIRIICRVEHGQGPRVPARCTMHSLTPYIDIPKRRNNILTSKVPNSEKTSYRLFKILNKMFFFNEGFPYVLRHILKGYYSHSVVEVSLET